MVQIRLYVGSLEEDEYEDVKSRLDEKLEDGEESYELLTEEPDATITPLTGDLPYLSVVNETLEKAHSVGDTESVNEILENLNVEDIESPERSAEQAY